MSIAFELYQPHVVESDGLLATPDLLIDSLAVALPGGAPMFVPVSLLSTAVAVQARAGQTLGAPAWVVIAAERGALLSVGVAQAEPGLADDHWAAQCAGIKLVSRSAWRIEAGKTPPAECRLVVSELDDALAVRAETAWTLGDSRKLHTRLDALLNGAELDKGRALLFAMDYPQRLEAGTRRVAIEADGRTPLVHEYRLLALEREE